MKASDLYRGRWRPWRRAWLGVCALLGACTSVARTPLPLADHVDVPRFLGQWYVIACLPTRIERHAWNEIETYRAGPGGRIDTVLTYSEGAADGPQRRYQPVGRVSPAGNGAIWRMQFIWPFQADYRVMYVDEAYSLTVIGREKRDYAWIMARTPAISPEDYAPLVERLRSGGYDVGRLRRVPHRP